MIMTAMVRRSDLNGNGRFSCYVILNIGLAKAAQAKMTMPRMPV